MTGLPAVQGPRVEPGLVTIAIPTFNGAPWLAEALASATGQTYPHLEILVVDDGSADTSVAIAEAVGDERVTIIRNTERLGLGGNWNRCLDIARGEFFKFLFQDDILDSDCVEQLARLMMEAPTVGLAFSPRRVVLDDPNDPAARLWERRYGSLHHALEPLERINDGRVLLNRQLVRAPFRNSIGEPTAVMLRTTVARAAGGFDPRSHQLLDAQMWLRMMFHADVGFIDRPLATFRVHRASATHAHHSSGVAWLDPYWFIESLVEDRAIRAVLPRPTLLRLKASALVLRGGLGRLVRR